jgi:RNA polymerase primary sigma factor
VSGGRRDMEDLSRKTLGPAFRMAVLSGAVEAVRQHLRNGADANAVDDRGRSVLLLAASRGYLEVCRLLLEGGANQAHCDNQGFDALCVARARGFPEIVTLLEAVANTEGADSAPELVGSSGGPTAAPAAAAPERENAATLAPFSSAPVLDISGWEAVVENPAPKDDPDSTRSAATVQQILSRHVALDRQESWDDIEIDLPDPRELLRKRVSLSPDQRQVLFGVIIEALRDGRIRADRIAASVPASTDSDDSDGSRWEAGLRLVLTDFGVQIDDDPDAPDSVEGASAQDEAQFGDQASEVFGFLRYHMAEWSDSLNAYLRSLPVERLTREDEIALGQQMEHGHLAVLAALSSCPEVVTQLLADVEVVLRAEVPARFMLEIESADAEETPTEGDAAEDEGEEAPSADSMGTTVSPAAIERLQPIHDMCRNAHPDPAILAAHLYFAGLKDTYREALQARAVELDSTGQTAARIARGLQKVSLARQRFVMANLRLVVFWAQKFRPLPLMDKIQEGNIGLMHAADKYSYRNGAKFSTYASWWIRQSIMRAIADSGRVIRLPVHVHESVRKIEKVQERLSDGAGRWPDIEQMAQLVEMSPERVKRLLAARLVEPLEIETCLERAENVIDATTTSPEDDCNANELREVVRDILEELEPRGERIIRMRFGITCDEHTLEEVGDQFGVTRERIRQIEAKMIRKLGSPVRKRRLHGCV